MAVMWAYHRRFDPLAIFPAYNVQGGDLGRFRLAGCSAIMFNEQHRIHAVIARLVPQGFYDGALCGAACVRTETPVTKMIKEVFIIEQALLFLDVVKSHAPDCSLEQTQ